MIYISYHGNIFDKNIDLENDLSYISNAINNNYNVLIDIELINDDYYLCNKKSKIELDFINKNIDYLWFNCLDNNTHLNLIKKFNNAKILNNNNIVYLPELNKNKYDIRNLKETSYIGICSSYIGWYKQLLEAQYYYALTINGRLNCHQYNLFPQIINYLTENKNEWIDIHIAINDDDDKLQSYLNNKYMDFPFIATITCKKFIVPEKYLRANTIYFGNDLIYCYNLISNFYTLGIVREQILTFNKSYDYNLIIKYRPDIVANKLPPLNNFLNISLNTVFTPSDYRYGFNSFMFNDQIGIGTPDSMYKYFNIYKYLDKYVFEDKIILHPESLLQYNLMQNNIDIKLFDYNYQLNNLRKVIK